MYCSEFSHKLYFLGKLCPPNKKYDLDFPTQSKPIHVNKWKWIMGYDFLFWTINDLNMDGPNDGLILSSFDKRSLFGSACSLN